MYGWALALGLLVSNYVHKIESVNDDHRQEHLIRI